MPTYDVLLEGPLVPCSVHNCPCGHFLFCQIRDELAPQIKAGTPLALDCFEGC